MEHIVILTGAGISAESGLKTFRDSDGLWENHRIEEVATPEAFEEDPRLVWRFYHLRREQLLTVGPNPAHVALARLQQALGPERVVLVTQNVDDLHERGGSPQVLHMHGELLKVRCTGCHQIVHTEAPQLSDPEGPLPTCQGCGSPTRPHIVWFGEMPFGMGEIQHRLLQCTTFLAIGTSGVVYPAAGFLSTARQRGATTIGFNLEPLAEHLQDGLFDEYYEGPASQTVPAWVDQALKSTLFTT